jgi:hypothetical protein
MTQTSGRDGVPGAQAVKRAADRTRAAGSRRAADMALRSIELQRKAFNGAIRGIGSLQDQTGKMLHRYMQSSSWVPAEGRQVVDEWTKATKRGREDFQKTMEKSFDLLTHFFKRVKTGEPAAKKKPAAKRKAPARKSAAKPPAMES